MIAEAPAARWDINSTCDIRLGEYFRDNTILGDKFLHIESAAAREISVDENDVLATAQYLDESAPEHDLEENQSYAIGIEGMTHTTVVHELKHVVDCTTKT